MEIVFYSMNGRPIAYTEDRGTIYLYTGEPVAYLSEGAVYAFSGAHLGWFAEGRLMDRTGRDVLFTNLSIGRPATPLRLAPLPKGVKRVRPVPRLKETEPIRPSRVRAWADTQPDRFFRPITVSRSRDGILAYVRFQPPHLYPLRSSQPSALVA
jgi:hypothetical protein